MTNNIILVFLVISCLIGCNNNPLIGRWKVNGLSADSLSISGYNDLLVTKNSQVEFINDKLNIYDSNSKIPRESYYYEVSDGELIIIYSDYGMPLTIDDNRKNELILYGGGWGNSIEEQKEYFIIVLTKIQND